MGLVAVRASLKQVEHEYIERRPWPIRECRDFLGDLNALLKGTTYVCISGSFIENETDEAGGKTSWLFGRLKTNKGCEGRDCDFTQEMTEEN
jgi:hypothetical protein